MLTDDEVLEALGYTYDPGGYYLTDARAVIAAYEAKLREQEPVALPFAILGDEMKDLHRFHECVSDGEGYDVPKERMKHLAEIGLVRRVTANIYEHTTFGLSVINGDFTYPAPIPEGWQPIETAPKDGTTILAKVFGKRSESTTREILWNGEIWITRDGSRFSEPTHWIPIPKPPMVAARSEE